MTDFINRLSSGAVAMGLIMAGGIIIALIAILIVAAWDFKQSKRR